MITSELVARVLNIIWGSLIAIIVTCIIEHLRKPSLLISVPEDREDRFLNYDREAFNDEGTPFSYARFLYLSVFHKQLPWWARWMMRQSASSCYGHITFHHFDTKERMAIPPMIIRWPDNGKPVSFDRESGKHVPNPNYNKEMSTRVEIYPGEYRLIDVVARIEDDVEAHGWNNEAYECEGTNWRNKSYCIRAGRCFVVVTVRSNGIRFRRVFYLENSGISKESRLRKADFINKIKVLRRLKAEGPEYSPRNPQRSV